ncbi:ATP-binding protein [Sapientia aquatica]|nr:ATP-binding protein [Sapientia aquatica]
MNQKWHAVKSNFIALTVILWFALFLSAMSVLVFNEYRNQEKIFNNKSAAITELVHQRLIQSEVVVGSIETILHIFDVIPFYGMEPSPNAKLAQFPHQHSLTKQSATTEFESLFKASASGLSLIDINAMPTLNIEAGNFDAVLFNRLRGYVKDIIVQYPYITSVTIEPRVEREEVTQFEEHAKSMLAMNYKIKSINQEPISRIDSIDTKANSTNPHSVFPHAFYYPVTFKEPIAKSDMKQLGVDMYDDPIWRDAIDRSIRTQKYAITKPFTVNNDRVFGLLKAVFATATPSTDVEIRHAQAAHVLSITINPIKLLSSDEMPSPNTMVKIDSGYFLNRSSNDTIAIFNPGAAPQLNRNWSNFLFPVFHYSHRNMNVQQPYLIESSRQVGWELFSGTATVISALISLGVALLAAALIRIRDQQKELTHNTNDIIFREKERALVTLHSINDAVLTLDSFGCINYANAAALTALHKDMDSINGLHVGRVLNLHYDFASSAIPDPIQTCLNEERIVDFPENTVLNIEQGLHQLIEGSISPLFNLDHRCIGAVLVFRDLGPARKKALAAIEASEKRLRQHQAELAHVTRLTTMGEMASGIAHEINQPLTAILSYNQACIRLIQEEHPDKEEIIRAMQSAALQAKRAGKIISRLRSFVTKKRAPVELIQINQLIQNVLTLIEHDLRDHEIAIDIDLIQSPALIAADGIQVEQVILNVIRNAMEAMSDVEPPQKVITIRSTQEFDRVAVSIKDHGSGIAKDDADQLFNPFFTTKKDGMGLGLTISTSIVESYGGQLSARNLEHGGAEFIVTFPIFKANTTVLSVTSNFNV